MTWTRLDDAYPHHPKLIEVSSLAALGLDVCAISYCNKQGTDGFVSDAALPVLYPPERNPKKLADKLIKVRRWDRDDERGGYVVHDFLEYNFSTDELERRTQMKAKAGRQGGLAAAAKRRAGAVADAQPTAVAPATEELTGLFDAEGYEADDVAVVMRKLDNRQRFGEPVKDPVEWSRPQIEKLAKARFSAERNSNGAPKRAEIDGETFELVEGQWQVVA